MSQRDERPPRRRKVALVFGEDDNDAEALINLANALRDDLPRMEHRRKPLVLVRGRKAAEDRKRNAIQILAVVNAAKVDSDVVFVVAHQDCDACEPAHEAVSQLIDKELSDVGIENVVSVAPAWETEAWWFLWPQAVAAVNSKWNILKRRGNHGMIVNAKEALRRDLRSTLTRDYAESDARRISAKVRDLRLVDKRQGQSNSFVAYETKIKSLDLG